MRIDRLDLRAFGPFTDVALDLSAGREGLHLIYGPNEAGKSSALRALRQMLFEIDVRTPDNFLHDYDKLRVGATLRNPDGSTLAFLRRKGNRRTLLSAADGSDLDDAALDRYLGRLTREQFETLFGFDHERLTLGGREIAGGQGHLGQLIFGAGSDLVRLRQLQKSLEEGWSDLFKKEGRKPPLNQALAELAEARQAIEAASIRGADWSAHTEALAEAHRRKAEVQAELDELQRRTARLERIERALPDLALRRELRAALASLADAPVLPEDFADQRRAVQDDIRLATRAEQAARAELAEIDQALGDLDVPETLLDEAPVIGALQLRLGAHLKEMRAVAKKRIEHQTLLDSARSLLLDLGRDDDLDRAESLRITTAQARRIQKLGNDRLALVNDCEAGAREIDAQTRAIDEAVAALDEPEADRDPDDLRAAIDRAVRKGDLQEQAAAVRKDLKRLERQAEAALRTLSPWSGTLEELEGLAVPRAPTIDRYQQELDAATAAVTTREERVAEQEDLVRALDLKIERQRLERALPSEAELAEARHRRDRGWRLIRSHWLDGRADPEALAAFTSPQGTTADLGSAFEHSVEQADALADRLLREALSVADRARWLADRQSAEERLATLRPELADARDHRQAVLDRWAEEWRPLGIVPRSPREMLAWLTEHAQLVEKAAQIRDRRETIADLLDQTEAHRRDLSDALRRLGEPKLQPRESLADLLRRAQQVVRQIDQAALDRQAKQRQLAEARADLVRAREREAEARRLFALWRDEWSRVLAPLGLPAETPPDEANAVLDQTRALLSALDQARGLRQQIETFDQDHAQLADDVRTLTRRIAPELIDLDERLAIEGLQDRLNAARQAQTRRDGLETRRARHREQQADARATIEAQTDRLERLCREAGCAEAADLPAVEERSSRRRSAEAELAAVLGRLRALSGGLAVEDFVAEAETTDPDSIGPTLARLRDQVATLTETRGELDQRIGREDNTLRSMEESSRATRALEASAQKHHLLARIEAHVERYVQLRLASAVLRDAIDRYAERNQGPVLRRAGALFADLTGGGFEGLRTELNARDEPALVGVRAGGGGTVGVDGMSAGTCDQLYLALKLASVEHYLDTSPPVPFVVDDVLVHFDDHRAMAALRALAALSRRTQVLFFTHHEHLVGLARAGLDPEVLFTHELRGGQADPAAAAG